MCMMSMVIEYGRDRVPGDSWRLESWDYFTKIILPAVEKLDEDLGEPDCVDPGKAEWVEEMNRMMAELEERTKNLEAEAFRRKQTTANVVQNFNI